MWSVSSPTQSDRRTSGTKKVTGPRTTRATGVAGRHPARRIVGLAYRWLARCYESWRLRSGRPEASQRVVFSSNRRRDPISVDHRLQLRRGQFAEEQSANIAGAR